MKKRKKIVLALSVLVIFALGLFLIIKSAHAEFSTTVQVGDAWNASFRKHANDGDRGIWVYPTDTNSVYCWNHGSLSPDTCTPDGTSIVWDGQVLKVGTVSASQIVGSATSTWGAITGTLSDQSDLSSALSSKEPSIASGTTSQYWRGDKSWQMLDKSVVGLGSVENTALSTWAGSVNVTTLGTITSGTWNAATIDIAKGGTGQTTASAALNALLPSQTGNAGKVLLTDGSNATWTATSTPARIQSSPTRSLDSCFQIAPTRDVLANYSVEIASSLSLSGGQDGTVFMEIYNDSGCTTGTQEVSRIRNGNTGTLTVGLNTVQTSTGNLTGYVPAGKYVKLRTSATTGTPTFTYRSGQEIQL